MTNSYRRKPFAPHVGGHSQGTAKRFGNRRMRRVNRVLVTKRSDVYRTVDEMMNPYDMPYDGSRRYRPFEAGSDYRDWWKWTKAK